MTTINLTNVMPGVGRVRDAVPVDADLTSREEGARRALNVAVAAVGIVLTAPLMLGIAILIRLTSPGPVLYRQARVGLNRRDTRLPSGNHRRAVDCGGVPFTIYKFRTMRVARAWGEDQRWAAQDDPRITPIGRVLRRYRLDELPQLFNVLMGDMNMVGPRPEQPRIFADLREQIPTYDLRQRVRPGITGWAQINQSYDATLEDVRRKVEYDLAYISRQSLTEDLKIMMLTAPVMMFKRGAW